MKNEKTTPLDSLRSLPHKLCLKLYQEGVTTVEDLLEYFINRDKRSIILEFLSLKPKEVAVIEYESRMLMPAYLAKIEKARRIKNDNWAGVGDSLYS